MATSWKFIKATPYTAVYRINGGPIGQGGPGIVDYTDAPTLANLVPGPLKTEITRRLGSLNALNLYLNSSRVRITYVDGIADPDGLWMTMRQGAQTIAWTGNGLTATLQAVPGAEGAADNIYVEIKFQHSRKR